MYFREGGRREEKGEGGRIRKGGARLCGFVDFGVCHGPLEGFGYVNIYLFLLTGARMTWYNICWYRLSHCQGHALGRVNKVLQSM
jgi:hypothetical protein